MDVLETLQAKVGFTDTEIKISDYILAHYEQVSGMSANALAKKTFCSNASVIRMCRKIGFSGYREFQISLAAHLLKKQKAEKPTKGYDSVSQGSNPSAMMKTLSETIAKAADSCFNRVSQDSLIRASCLMSRANRLCVYGADSFNALVFCQAMSRLGIASIARDFQGGEESVLERDVSLFIACSEDSLDGLRKKMISLRKRGCRVIAISTESVCPDADILIRFPQVETNSPYAETACLQTMFLYITTCLNYMTGEAKRLQTVKTLE